MAPTPQSFDTDSSMFHVNEAYEGKGTLTVKDGQMTIHVSLSRKGLSESFHGKRQRMHRKTEQSFLQPTTETVDLGDGQNFGGGLWLRCPGAGHWMKSLTVAADRQTRANGMTIRSAYPIRNSSGLIAKRTAAAEKVRRSC